jgi:hypothetical protein
VITNLDVVPSPGGKPLLSRADANADGTADISDAITILGFMGRSTGFTGAAQPSRATGLR